MLECIAKRKKTCIGHVVRGDGLLKLVIEGRTEGKKPRGRPRMGMIDDIMMGSNEHMKRRALDEKAGVLDAKNLPCDRELIMISKILLSDTEIKSHFILKLITMHLKTHNRNTMLDIRIKPS